MISPKTIELVFRLQNLTMQDLLCWKETVNEGVFQIAYPNFAVKIFKRDNSDYYEGEVIVQIFNENAALMEEVSIKDMEKDEYFSQFSSPSAIQFMYDFYQKARSQALGVERVINDILTELNKLSPPQSEGEDIPF